ncbi:MAG: signal peptidase I [Clostridiales bacterium]|nr:signal peptidase I [Clostridiales bacterium]
MAFLARYRGSSVSESNKKTLRAFTTVLVCLAIVFAFFISIIRVFGFQVYGVLTGSMEPAYPTGSLIYVRSVDASTLRVNDVITFSLSPNVIATHRIVDIVQDESNPGQYKFQTKGDANKSVDASLVSPTHIIGKVIFSIPYLGDIANYIQNPPGTYVAILVSGILIFLVFLTDAATGDKFKFLQKKQDPAQQQPAAPNAPYPAGQQPMGYPQNPAGYPPQQAPQMGYPQQAHNAYPQQQAQRYPAQQPVQNGYQHQPTGNGYPQQPQRQMNAYPYPQRAQFPQQGAQQPYPQRPQPMQNGYRAPQSAGYPQQPPQQRVAPPQQLAQPAGQQGFAQQPPRNVNNGQPAYQGFQPSGFHPSSQPDGAPQRRRRSNTNSSSLS